MKKIITSLMLFIAYSLQANPLEYFILDYCEYRLDDISYNLTHGFDRDAYERRYMYGQFDAFSEIIQLLESEEQKESLF